MFLYQAFQNCESSIKTKTQQNQVKIAKLIDDTNKYTKLDLLRLVGQD